MRTYRSFPIDNLEIIKIQMLNWGYQFNIFCFLDNHQYQLQHHSLECIMAVGAESYVQSIPGRDSFELLRKFQIDHPDDWLFGHLSYDLKNEIEGLKSNHPDNIGFPDLLFFHPKIILKLSSKELTIGVLSDDANSVFNQISAAPYSTNRRAADYKIQSRFSKAEYRSAVKKLQQHILRGDCYEINFCQEFYSENADVDPLQVFVALSKTSPNPFAAFYKVDDKFLLCASPERFLKKEGEYIYSQPIKGTAKRSPANSLQDEESKRQLQQSSKERSENVMVVDLVRNDLSRFCVEGSVEVEALFTIESFPQVHQMTSTVKGRLDPSIEKVDIIRYCFPMGSMTGAPKRRVMELIESYEKSRRGLFSGSVGYFSPEGDFDLNVVIRSILFNKTNRYLSFQTGSAITYYSDSEKEYEECLLKAAAIKKVLE